MSPVLVRLSDPGDGPAAMVKDTIDVAGVPTRAGSRAFASAQPASSDAEVVVALRRAGWRIVGKTKLHELAFGPTGVNAHDGTPVNPRWPDIVPGGSSSGSAVAVAAGLVPLALGTDTGGSVRVPAACCGIFGLKPTFGLVSRVGVMPPDTSLDCVGPLARDMPTLIAAMQAIVPGFDPPPVPRRLRIGVLDVAAAPPIQDSVAAALARLADESDDAIRLVPLHSPSFDEAFRAGLTIINAEAWGAYGSLVGSGLLGADIDRRLRAAGPVAAGALAQADAVRTRFRAEIDALLADCPILALPTMREAPPLLSAAETSAAVAMTALVRPFNLSGHPAITLPLAAAPGFPIALQMVAQRGADGLLCAVAADVSRRLGLTSAARVLGPNYV